jgi:hypothetical protein
MEDNHEMDVKEIGFQDVEWIQLVHVQLQSRSAVVVALLPTPAAPSKKSRRFFLPVGLQSLKDLGHIGGFLSYSD